MSSLAIKKVLISDKVDASCKDILLKNGIEVDLKPGRSVDELKADIKNYDALIVRSATKVTPDIIELGSNLKLIGRAGTGVDNIDLPSASSNGVLVMNTPGGNTISAVEHTCALISAVARHVGQGHASLKEGKWERSKFMGCELLGKTLAIVGLGRIGREVAIRMQSYGMKTIGFDPLVSPEEAAQYGIEWMEVEKLWPLTDFVTVHTPLIPQTRGLVNAKVFATKPGIRVVNVARGGIIDETDLLAALDDGTCAGAALDVFETEPPTGVSMKLAMHPKVLCTPHLGASTSEAQLRVAGEIAEQIVDAVNGKPMVGLVNAPALAESANPIYKPWLELATKLGTLGQTVVSCRGNFSKVHVTTCGSTLSSVARLMMVAASYGVAKWKNPAANMISCGELLKKQGVTVTCEHNKSAGAADGISIQVGDQCFAGILNGDIPLLVNVCGVPLVSPVSLTGNLIISDSSTNSPSAFIQSLNGAAITSISTGSSGSSAVMVASVAGTVGPLETPLRFIKL